MGALELIDGWEVDRVAAVVVGVDGPLDRRGPVDEPFELASVTKLLTAMAVLVGVEEGVIDLDGVAGPPGSTVRHLLCHASGLSPEGEVLAAPGQRRTYSNAGYDVLGLHLEERTSIDVGTYLAEAVLAPLATSSTHLAGSPAFAGVGTASDLGAVAHEVLVPARVLAEDTVVEATRVQLPGLSGVLPGFGRQDPNDWGLGFELRSTKSPHWTATRASPATAGHFGASGTFVWVDPEAQLALVCLSDRAFGPWAAEAWPTLSDAVLEENRR